jgi:Xaa-Pro aminopeptidase
MADSEEVLVAGLLDAQAKAQALFGEVEIQKLIRPGVTEREVNENIYALAERMYGIKRYWHKRIVRAGRNTLAPYAENPPDLTVTEDDIAFIDLGPVFEEWEADFGRTYVVGNDPLKNKLRDDIAIAFAKGKQHFHANPEITGAELYAYAHRLAKEAGWEFGGPIAGHLIGLFPHEKIVGDMVTLYIHPDNPGKLQAPYPDGRKRHWILEIHFVDREREIGGFHEELMTIG